MHAMLVLMLQGIPNHYLKPSDVKIKDKVVNADPLYVVESISRTDFIHRMNSVVLQCARTVELERDLLSSLEKDRAKVGSMTMIHDYDLTSLSLLF